MIVRTSNAFLIFSSDDLSRSWLYNSELAMDRCLRVQQHKTVVIMLYLIFCRKRKNSFHMTSVSSLLKGSTCSSRLSEHSSSTFFKIIILGASYAPLPFRGLTLFSAPSSFPASNFVGLLAAYRNIIWVKRTKNWVLAWAMRVIKYPTAIKPIESPPN